MSPPPLIDRAIVDETIAHIGEEAMRMVIDLFVSETAGLIESMRAAVADDDPVRLDNARRAAHSLKSSAGQIGAAALSEAARQVETTAHDRSPGLGSHVATLALCAAETERAIAELFRR